MAFYVQNNTTTYEQLGSWKDIFLMHHFPVVDVPPPRYGRIYNILSNDNQYDIIINNFPGCSCVYFVKMLAGFLGAHGAYV